LKRALEVCSKKLSAEALIFIIIMLLVLFWRGGSAAGLQLRVRFVPAALLAMLRTALALL
jgi:hypothetical protein